MLVGWCVFVLLFLLSFRITKFVFLSVWGGFSFWVFFFFFSCTALRGVMSQDSLLLPYFPTTTHNLLCVLCVVCVWMCVFSLFGKIEGKGLCSIRSDGGRELLFPCFAPAPLPLCLSSSPRKNVCSLIYISIFYIDVCVCVCVCFITVI